jgi:GNAT superfamily N-acetyltransferase
MEDEMIIYRQHDGILDDAVLYELCTLVQALEGHPDIPVESYMKNARAGVDGRPWVHVALAYDDAELVGYKLGRSDDPCCFESWRGGVKLDYRRRGIADQLAAAQEEWCRHHNFGCIVTHTNPDNAPMLILNLRRGFTISGTVLVRGVNMNVVLHKSLKTVES